MSFSPNLPEGIMGLYKVFKFAVKVRFCLQINKNVLIDRFSNGVQDETSPQKNCTLLTFNVDTDVFMAFVRLVTLFAEQVCSVT